MKSKFLIKLLSWEYWPMFVVYFPITLYYLMLSLRAKSLLFFTGSNPGIENGGMFGESKFKILELIPEQFRPKMLFVDPKNGLPSQRDLEGIAFPFIAKPDVGERGRMVKIIRGPQDLIQYHHDSKFAYIIQEYLDMPFECGIFYYRLPGQNTGVVSSVVIKEFLSVTGNGKDNLKTLMSKSDRARLQIERLEKEGTDMALVLKKNERMQLVPIGNHCLGTKFKNGNEIINDQLVGVFDQLSLQVEGFYYGRYDLRSESIDALYQGDFQIMELNGAGAEPAHIYNPGFPIAEAYRSLFSHWKMMFTIAMVNKKNGYKFLSLKEGIGIYRTYKKVIQ